MQFKSIIVSKGNLAVNEIDVPALLPTEWTRLSAH